MSISQTTRRHLISLAETTLEAFATISRAANAKLSTSRPSPENVLVDVNAVTSLRAINSLQRITAVNRENYQRLLYEPAIARIVAHDEKNHRHTIFICRTTPITLPDRTPTLASYRSPVGRLASLDVGENLQLSTGKRYEIVEKALLNPVRFGQEWDSRPSELESHTYGFLTVESFRNLFPSVSLGDFDEEILDSLLSDEAQQENVSEGTRRTVIMRMELRDRPILDKFQDNIFRLPLDSRLFLNWPSRNRQDNYVDSAARTKSGHGVSERGRTPDRSESRRDRRAPSLYELVDVHPDHLTSAVHKGVLFPRRSTGV